tara:strand:- start:8803 stop:9774 length:972 start_codon:yes stop_codon:yes gene_type:complete
VIGMGVINSVTGEINPEDLGSTLTHEHIMVASGGIPQTYPEYINRAAIVEEGVKLLSAARSEGNVQTIIDLSTVDLGRDVAMLREVSLGSGVNIIAATGNWRDIPRVFWNESPDTIASLYSREIEVGIDGTGIKAGIIKVANDVEGVTETAEIVLRAAARAQIRTDVPISTHTAARERVGDQQIAIFEDEGVDLNRVYIGHSNDSTDIGYLTGLMDKGAWVGLDRYPGNPSVAENPNWEERTETIKKLIDAGYGNRIMVSHDWAVRMFIASPEIRAERDIRNPDGWLFIYRNVLPRLRSLGVKEEEIQAIIVDNPRRFFEGKK